MGYTWMCKGCGKQGTTKFATEEKAKQAGHNHWRGLAAALYSQNQIRKCISGIEVIRVE